MVRKEPYDSPKIKVSELELEDDIVTASNEDEDEYKDDVYEDDFFW